MKLEKTQKELFLLGRHKDNFKEREDNPGPGTYDVKAKTFHNGYGTVSFGHGERFNNPSNTPGNTENNGNLKS